MPSSTVAIPPQEASLGPALAAVPTETRSLDAAAEAELEGPSPEASAVGAASWEAASFGRTVSPARVSSSKSTSARVASWPVPQWSAATEEAGGLITYSQVVGSVAGLADDSAAPREVTVAISQYEAVSVQEREVTVRRQPVEIFVGDARLTPAAARELAALLLRAGELVDG